MKKLILAAAILAAFTIVSCSKKDRVCECTGTDGTYSIKLTDKSTKGEANTICKGLKVKESDGTEDPAQDPGESCKLK